MKKLFFFFSSLLILNTIMVAQNVGIGTTTPDKSAVLELSATNKGFLPPQMNAVQKGQIQTPKKGLMIYQTDGVAGLYIFNGSAWLAVASLVNTWNVNGNAGTDPVNNFIGTTDAQPLVFRAGNNYAGRIGNNGMVAIGKGAGSMFSDGSVVAIGNDALLNNGTGASGTEGGKYNTALGSDALKANTTGLQNTASGSGALKANTAGNHNTANGAAALYSNIDGDENTAFGYNALSQNTESRNTAVGAYALRLNTTGLVNTATGANALFANTTGSYNVANGNGALAYNNTGNYNTAVGNAALQYNKEDDNTAIGYNALNKNIDGSSNTATGSHALAENLGYSNTANGASALLLNTAGESNTAMGQAALLNNTLGNFNVAVGKNGLAANTSGGYNTSLGVGSLPDNTTGTDNVGIGYNALSANSTGKYNTGVGTSAGVTTGNLTNATAVGAYAKVACSNCVVLGASESVFGAASGKINVGIGLNTPQAPLDIKQYDYISGLRLRYANWVWDICTSNGGGVNFTYNGVVKSYISPIDGAYVAISDARFKKDINKMNNVLDKVMALQAKSYKYLDNKETDKRSSGFLAQEVMPLFPELVSDFQHPINDTTDNTIYHGINYAGFGVIAIKAIQEQQQQIEAANAENKMMMKLIENMQSEITALKQKINN